MKPTRLKPLAAALLLAALCWSAADAAESDLSAALAQYDRLAEVALPALSEAQLARLAAGETVIVRERRPLRTVDGEAQDHIRVVGLRSVPRPRLLVWLAALDIGTAHSRRLTEHLLEVKPGGGSVWYQYLDTPWPVSNRHWVIRTRKNVDLAVASEDLIWEHAWRLVAHGERLAGNILRAGEVSDLTERDGQRAIYLDVNRGAWTMLAVDAETTLVAAHTSAVMGGWIPETWVARFVAKQLGDVLGRLEARADGIHQRYTGSYPVYTGSGLLVTPEMARESFATSAATRDTGERPARP